jgi:hypothetical protein
MKTKYEKRGDAKTTDKLIERTVVKKWGDELFSIVLTDDELNALTAAQLREVVEVVTACTCESVVRRSDGTLSVIDYSGCDGEQFCARIVNHSDGSFEVKEYRKGNCWFDPCAVIERIERVHGVSRDEAIKIHRTVFAEPAKDAP